MSHLIFTKCNYFDLYHHMQTSSYPDPKPHKKTDHGLALTSSRLRVLIPMKYINMAIYR